MNDTPSPTSGSRDLLERQVLLRASGELSAVESHPLEAALAGDAEAAAFARFAEDELPLASKAPRDFVAAAMEGVERAPRDFAAAAIAATASESAPQNVLAMPRVWKWSAAAAAVAVLAFVVARQWPTGTAPAPVIAAAAEPRITTQLTARLSALDEEISAARTTLARGRYQRSTTL